MANTDIPGELAGYKVYLTPSVEAAQRYQRRYVPVDIVEGGTAEDRLLFTGKGERIWEIRSWKGGEGNQYWRRGDNRYRVAEGIRPARFEEGLELSAHWSATRLVGGSPFDAQLVWLGTDSDGIERIWGIDFDYDARWLIPPTSDIAYWNSTEETGMTPSGGLIVSAVPMGNWNYVSFGDESVWRFNETGANVVIGGGSPPWTIGPTLTVFGGQLFALGSQDLYLIEPGAPGSAEKVVDNNIHDPGYATDTRPSWMSRRMTASDVGPIWLAHDQSGNNHIWQYNVAADVSSIIGQAGPQGWWPMGIAWLQGVIFVLLYTQGNPYSHYIGTDPGRAYLYHQAGNVRGLIGPIQTDLSTRDDEISEADTAPILVGTTASELLFFTRQRLWGYDLSTGALYRITGEIDSGAGWSAVESGTVFGDVVVLANAVDVGGGSIRPVTVSLDRYKEPSPTYSTLYTGHFDFDQPGFPKRLIDVTVLSEPLPADCSIDVAIQIDRFGPVTTDVGMSNVEGTTVHTFDFSTANRNLVGFEFELRLRLDYNGAELFASSPFIRSVYARAVSGATIREWVLAVDLNRTGEHFPVAGTTTDFVDALEEAVDAHGQVTFTDPWMVREGATPTSFDVTIEELSFLHTDSGELDYCVVRLRNDDWL